jgi:hypothetical protein
MPQTRFGSKTSISLRSISRAKNMANTILPYENLGETLAVHLNLPKIPHKSLSEHSILVDSAAIGTPSIAVDIEAQVPSKIDQAFPVSERGALPMEVVATIVSIDAGIRGSISLKQQKPSLYTAKIALDLTQISEAVELCVYVVRSKQGTGPLPVKGPRFARQKGCRLAWGPTHEIRFQERPPRGDFLDIKWEDFSSSTVVPGGFERAMYYVDAESDPPVLYLNKLAAPPLQQLLRTEGSGHPKARARDLLFRSIANDAWFVLVQAALDALRKEAFLVGTPADLGAIDASWMREIIELVAPMVLPRLPAEDAVLELCTKMDDDNYYADTLLRAAVAVQTDQDIREHFEKFAESVYEHG